MNRQLILSTTPVTAPAVSHVSLVFPNNRSLLIINFQSLIFPVFLSFLNVPLVQPMAVSCAARLAKILFAFLICTTSKGPFSRIAPEYLG